MQKEGIDLERAQQLSKKEYLAEEKRIVAGSMMMTGGMMGAYTYVMRGGVFCNAQSANIVMMGIEFGKQNWMHALYFLIPVSAYIAGAVVSEILRDQKNRWGFLKWNTVFVGAELVSLFCIGWIPLSWPDQIVQILINFLASMQYNSFQKAEGIPIATTFCTNHIRQLGIWIVHYLKKRDPDSSHRIWIHLFMLLCFLFGAAAETVCASLFNEKAIWAAVIPLGLALFVLMSADLNKNPLLSFPFRSKLSHTIHKYGHTV